MGQLPSNALDAEKQEFLASLPEVPELSCLSYQLNINGSDSKKLNGNGGIMAIMASRIVFHTCNRLQPAFGLCQECPALLPRVPRVWKGVILSNLTKAVLRLVHMTHPRNRMLLRAFHARKMDSEQTFHTITRYHPSFIS